MGTNHISQVTAITEVLGEGQKVVAVAAEYDDFLDPRSISKEKFAVIGRTVTGAYLNSTVRRENAGRGNVVIAELDPSDEGCATLSYIPRHGEFTGSDAVIATPRPIFVQTAPITAADGTLVSPQAPVAGTKTLDLVVSEFKTYTLELAGGGTIDYNLYIPKLEPGKRYPLVYFIEDAGVLSYDMAVTLAQGLGATVWARPEEQAKRPCFVLAPQFHGPRSLVEDDFSCTAEVDAAHELLKYVMSAYPVDAKRIYGTGQSMGCMTTCELNMRDPELYGGCLLIGGQWDPEGMVAAKENNFWICVSTGDEKAFPGMNAIVEAFEKAGTTVGKAALNGADMAEANRTVERLSRDGNHIHYTWFEGDSVIPAGVEPSGHTHHRNSWRVAYQLESLRQWLFDQHRP